MAIIYRDYENGEHRISLRVFTQVQYVLLMDQKPVCRGVKDHSVGR